VSALRKTVAVLARLGTELQTERQAQRAKLAAAPEEVKAARISPGLIKRLRARLGITQGELATLVGVSTSAVGSWE
jgi:DNA-binding transcriptional regulator YiaG